MLQPQDLGLLGYIIMYQSTFPASDGDLSHATYHCAMTEIELLESLERLLSCTLVSKATGQVNIMSATDTLFVISHIFPGVVSEEETVGIPTAWCAQPLADMQLVQDPLPIVWQHDQFPTADLVTGVKVEPLFPKAVEMAKRSPDLYRWLAVLDCLRYGKAREIAWARNYISKTFSTYYSAMCATGPTSNRLSNLICA